MTVRDLTDCGLRGDYITAWGWNSDSFDNAPKWNELAATAKPGDEWILPWTYGGFYGFSSPIVPLPAGVSLIGRGGLRPSLIRDYEWPGSFLTLGPYTQIENIEVSSYPFDVPAGVAIGCVATNADDAPMQIRLRCVEVSAFGKEPAWFGGINLDAIHGAPMYGARDLVMDDIIVARFSGYGIRLASINACRFSNMVIIDDYGEYAGLWITGSSNNPNNGISWNGAGIGKLFLEHVHCAKFDVAALAFNAAIDEHCAGVEVNAAAVSGPPMYVRGQSNRIYVNGKLYAESPS